MSEPKYTGTHWLKADRMVARWAIVERFGALVGGCAEPDSPQGPKAGQPGYLPSTVIDHASVALAIRRLGLATLAPWLLWYYNVATVEPRPCARTQATARLHRRSAQQVQEAARRMLVGHLAEGIASDERLLAELDRKKIEHS